MFNAKLIDCFAYTVAYIIYATSREAFEGGDFFAGRVQSSDGGQAFLFVSAVLLRLLGEVPDIQADGTFRTVPRLFTQLFTIHASRFGQVNQLPSPRFCV